MQQVQVQKQNATVCPPSLCAGARRVWTGVRLAPSAWNTVCKTVARS